MLDADKNPLWGEYPYSACILLLLTITGKRQITWQPELHSDSLSHTSPVSTTERLHSLS